MVQTLLFTTCKRSELYRDEGYIKEETARHLFRVAAGLESPLLGETAILGQLKRNYFEAKAKERLSPNLNKLFQSAIHVGHRVRTETGISRGAVSYSQVTVDILCRELPDLGNKVVSIIGINEMTESILNFLTARGATNIILANRSIEKAEKTLLRLLPLEGGEITILPLAEKKRIIELSDVVISATSAPHEIIKFSDLPLSRARSLVMFDLANPNDIAPTVTMLPYVTLFNLEEIESQAQQNKKARQAEISKCEAIIEEEIDNILHWQEQRRRRAV